MAFHQDAGGRARALESRCSSTRVFEDRRYAAEGHPTDCHRTALTIEHAYRQMTIVVCRVFSSLYVVRGTLAPTAKVRLRVPECALLPRPTILSR